MTDLLGRKFLVNQEVAYAAKGTYDTALVVARVREVDEAGRRLVVLPIKRSAGGARGSRAVAIRPDKVVVLAGVGDLPTAESVAQAVDRL